MEQSRRSVWNGHASRALVAGIFAAHFAALIWLVCDVDRLRLIGYDFREVWSEAAINDPPDALRAIGYTEDDASELALFRAIAQPIVSGAASDGEKMRRLGDHIYSLRGVGAPDFSGVRSGPLSVIWPALQRGEHGSCLEMSAVLGAFWRSLGGHTRAVRWATAEGAIGHDAIELYSEEHHKWVYYDMNLNGYGEEDDDTPLSLAALRSNLLTDEDVHLVTARLAHDWTAREFRDELRDYPVEWYVLNNRVLYFEPGRRFGRFNRFAPMLGRLPSPAGRVLDNILGDRDRRLVIEGKIQIADLFTFEGARWFLAYLVALTTLCGGTLAGSRLAHAARRIAAAVRPIVGDGQREGSQRPSRFTQGST